MDTNNGIVMFAVIKGEYSDWEIIGYFEIEDDAKKYCAIHNGVNEKVWQNEYYYEEIEKINLTGKQHEIKIYYQHEVAFDFKNGNFKMRDEPERYECKVVKNSKAKTEYFMNSDYTKGWLLYHINCKSRKKAEKIAQDRLTLLQVLALDSNLKQALASLDY